MAERVIPYGRQCIDDDDLRAVAEALCAEFLTTGPRVEAFEQAFARETGAAHAVACCNGTAALHLAALAAGLGSGDWCVVPSQTFLATANAARYCGADVWFSDVDAASGLMDTRHLEAALDAAGGRRVRAVFPVHLNGHVVDMEALSRVARVRGLRVIEDGCHALGTCYRVGNGDARVGDCRFSDMTTFSLHPVKTMTSGEGGVVTTNDPSLAARMREIRNHGMVRDPSRFASAAEGLDARGTANPWYYEMQQIGYNFRITDFQCALGASQLAKLGAFSARRRELRRLYDERIAGLAPRVRPVASREGVDPVLHLYAVHIDFRGIGVDRAALMARLRDCGVGTQVHYFPVHQQPYYRALYGGVHLPGAREYYEHALSLPFFPAMADGDVDAVVSAVERAIR